MPLSGIVAIIIIGIIYPLSQPVTARQHFFRRNFIPRQQSFADTPHDGRFTGNPPEGVRMLFRRAADFPYQLISRCRIPRRRPVQPKRMMDDAISQGTFFLTILNLQNDFKNAVVSCLFKDHRGGRYGSLIRDKDELVRRFLW